MKLSYKTLERKERKTPFEPLKSITEEVNSLAELVEMGLIDEKDVKRKANRLRRMQLLTIVKEKGGRKPKMYNHATREELKQKRSIEGMRQDHTEQKIKSLKDKLLDGIDELPEASDPSGEEPK